MSNSMVWGSRVFGYVCIGLFTFITATRAESSRLLTFQAAVYAAIGLAIVAWSVLDRRTPADAPRGRWLPVTLGVVSALAGMLAATPNGAVVVVLACIAALVAGSDSAFGAALTVAGVGVLSVMVSLVVTGGASAAAMVGLPLAIGAGLILGLHRRTYRTQAEQSALLLARSEELRVQQRRADVLDERTRIAREIHDVLAHSIGGLGIQIQAARAVLTDYRDVDRALDVLATAQKLATDGLTETRRAVHALRTDTLGLDEELRNLASGHAKLHGAPVDVTIDGTPVDLPPASALALLRVAQEAAVNAAKHAPGHRVAMHLTHTPDQVRLTVTNPVPDTPAAPPSLRTIDGGYGLTGMRERLLLIGGTLHAGRDGPTWTVTAELPVTGTATPAEPHQPKPANPSEHKPSSTTSTSRATSADPDTSTGQDTRTGD